MKRKLKSNKPGIIMAHDPSFTAWGYSVFDVDGIVVESGCIKTESENKNRRIRKGDDDIRRIQEINSRLLKVIHRNNIRLHVAELPHGSQSYAVAKMIGIVSGILTTICACLDKSLEWYSEADAKRELLGKDTATKAETISAISKHYRVPWTGVKYVDEAVADSVSIYNVAKVQSPTLKILLNEHSVSK